MVEKIERMKVSVAALNPATVTIEEIERVICDFGLVYWPPANNYGEWAAYMCEDRLDLAVYQTPRQFAGAIHELLKYKLNSYIEIGIFSGGSYLIMCEFLRLRNPGIRTVGVDISTQYMKPETIPYLTGLHIGTSADFRGQRFDLAFIDGDHSYEGVKTDYQNIGPQTKIVMFHDINESSCPGVVRFWNEVKGIKSFKEYTYQTNGKAVQGIGLLFNQEMP